MILQRESRPPVTAFGQSHLAVRRLLDIAFLAYILLLTVQPTLGTPTQKAPEPKTSGQAEVLCESAQQKLMARQSKEAIADLDRAIQLDPKCARAYYLRAGLRHMQHDLQGALDDCNHAISIEPRPIFYFQRAISQYRLRKVDECIADCTIAIKGLPNFAGSYAYRARCLAEKGDTKAALSDCDTAIKVAHNADEANEIKSLKEQLISLHRDQAKIQEGYDAAKSAPEIKPKHVRQAFASKGHNFEVLPPENFTLQETTIPFGKDFTFAGPPHQHSLRPVLSAMIHVLDKDEDSPPPDAVLESMLHPFKLHCSHYAEQFKALTINGIAYRAAYFSGEIGGKVPVKGIFLVAIKNNTVFIFSAQDGKDFFAQTESTLLKMLESCRLS